MRDIQEANGEFGSGGDPETEYVVHRVPQCVRYLPFWSGNRCAYRAVKTVKDLGNFLRALVDAIDWTLFPENDVLCDRAEKTNKPLDTVQGEGSRCQGRCKAGQSGTSKIASAVC